MMKTGHGSTVASPGFLIRRLQQLAVSMFAQALEEFSITPIQYTILNLLERSEHLDQGAIATGSVLDASTVTDVVSRLEKRGFLIREVSSEDKRKKVVRITPAGRELLQATAPYVDVSRKRLLSPLTSAEATTLLALIEKLLEAHQKSSDQPSRPWRRLKAIR